VAILPSSKKAVKRRSRRLVGIGREASSFDESHVALTRIERQYSLALGDGIPEGRLFESYKENGGEGG
jgi:hypothetical protein